MRAESPEGPVFSVPTRARESLRRSIVVAAVVGGIGLAVAGFYGYLALVGFLCVGLVLGAVNAVLVQRSIVKESAAANPSKGSLLQGVALRLGAVTVIAVALSAFFFPDGLGTFIGLAVFQAINSIVSAVPALKELRQ